MEPEKKKEEASASKLHDGLGPSPSPLRAAAAAAAPFRIFWRLFIRFRILTIGVFGLVLGEEVSCPLMRGTSC